MIPLLYLIIVGLFGIFSLVIVYHLYRFGVNKGFLSFIILAYLAVSLIIITRGLLIVSKL